MECLNKLAPSVQVYSIDEAFICLDGINYISPYNFCSDLRRKIVQWVGIPVSIGIASSKTLAKAASKIAKEKSGVYSAITRDKQETLLNTLKLTDIWGISLRSQKIRKYQHKNTFRVKKI